MGEYRFDVVDVGDLHEIPDSVCLQVVGSRKPIILDILPFEVFMPQPIVGHARNLDDKIHLLTACRLDHRYEVRHI